MKFKLVVISAACFAFFVQPAHSGSITDLKNAALGTTSDIVSIIPRMIKAKGAAVARAAADMASILVMGKGLEVNALGTAATEMKHAVSDGLYAIGDTITKAGNTITGDFPNFNNPGTSFRVPPYGARCVTDPCHQEALDYGIRSPTYHHRLPVWRLLRDAVEKRMHGRGRYVNIGHGVARRLPLVYEIIHTPRFYQGPAGTYYIQRK